MSIILYLFFNISSAFISFLKRRRITDIYFGLFGLLLTTTYYNGSDWRTYEPLFNELNRFDYYRHWSPGLEFVFRAFSSINLNFHWTLIILKLAVFVFVFKYINKLSSKPSYSFTVFIFIAAYGLFIDNPLRQMLAIPFVALMMYYCYKRNYLMFILSVFAGSFFHSSALTFIILPLILAIRLTNRAYLSLLLFAWLFSFNIEYFASYLSVLFSGSELLSFYVRHYFVFEADRLSVSAIVFSFVFLIMLKYRQLLTKDSFSRFLEPLAFLFAINVVISSVNVDFLRFNYYLAIPFSIYMSDIAHSMKITQGNKSMLLKSVVLVSFLVLNLSTVITSYKYLPYTNYIYSFIVGDELSYETRAIKQLP